MRIALDGLPLSRELTGIGHYTLELGRHLAENSADHVSVLSPRAFVPTVTSTLVPSNLKPLQPTVNPVIRFWWKFGLPKFLSKDGIEVFHGTNFELPSQPACATVLTIHDLSTLLHPETHEHQNVQRAQRSLPLTAQTATMIICPTEAVRQEVHEHLMIPLERIVAVHEAARNCFSPASDREIARVKQRFNTGDEFLLYVGTIEPRKNLLSLVLAFEQLVVTHPDLRLVIAGRKGWMVDELFAYVARSPVSKRIIFTGYVSDVDLRSLYSSCTVFVYPSIYEGFGLPPLEAMSCGAPVVASSIPSIAEVLDGAARLVEPDDFEMLKGTLEELLNDRELRERLSSVGREHAAQFSWAETAVKVREVYARASERHRKNALV